MSEDEGPGLFFPVDAELERRLILAQGLYPADRLFAPVLVGRNRED